MIAQRPTSLCTARNRFLPVSILDSVCLSTFIPTYIPQCSVRIFDVFGSVAVEIDAHLHLDNSQSRGPIKLRAELTPLYQQNHVRRFMSTPKSSSAPTLKKVSTQPRAAAWYSPVMQAYGRRRSQI